LVGTFSACSIDVELAEAPAERDLLIRRHALPAEDQHRVLMKSLHHFLEGMVVEVPRQVEPGYLGTDR
jgi:hypothetical protein